MTDTTTPTGTVGTPVLDSHRLYFAGDRVLCIECAGNTAQYTGVTYDHHRLTTVTARDVAEWRSITDLPLTCTCRRLEATTTVATHNGPAPTAPTQAPE